MHFTGLPFIENPNRTAKVLHYFGMATGIDTVTLLT